MIKRMMFRRRITRLRELEAQMPLLELAEKEYGISSYTDRLISAKKEEAKLRAKLLLYHDFPPPLDKPLGNSPRSG